MKKILFTGCAGQIGSELTLAFRKLYGNDNIIASDLSTKVCPDLLNSGPFVQLDVLDTKALGETIDKYKVDGIVHLAAILSAVGEKNPQLAWNVNINGTVNVFEVAREKKLERVLVPSSIAAFGPDTPRTMTPQKTILHPTTMYGVTKVALELLGNYYNLKYDMDIRGLRYPGVISHKTQPGGGTTDYAVAIYFDAVKQGSYECFLTEDTMLPMIYMPDCLKATIELFQAEKSRLQNATGYNLAAFSVTPKEMTESIQKVIPDFKISYSPDYRQEIADSWPDSIDDKEARDEWDWKPDYDLDSMTVDIIKEIRLK
ncbi:NAD-dependent epimerase/dehydratase family protein [Dysgonomonas sp. HDW5A]|uniref:NAD-dependent epimerase/dehydratase family protein n=1 Tax=unclassified Dysgonomonas TaxID=2630389 RepID=UPI00140D4333|nr:MULTISPECIES: NAD-dependent epimerase/dehydratase family protein [unclassified Dysgonomonas]QIK55138.1 NAD-dependent epimerase/dehydratase family protein [Dysgonomonas sp. HDW5B]QIK60567.1 NAD-dependent epimerase/dehydratase family protein [Dysgonomonas sp. HDW5A]